MSDDDKQLVFKIEEGMDRSKVLATTYQMRNFYQQFHDGFFTALDVMNYIQHHTVVRMVKKGERVLDMCCGRGLLLPMLRYYAKEIESYTGIDIQPSNATFRTKRVNDNKPISGDYYPFRVSYVEGNVAEMTTKFKKAFFSFIVYTSSIEHMHPDLGLKSLYEAREVAQHGAILYLSCPNTPEDQDGYDTQYAAHVYEWKRSEIEAGLKESGWDLADVYGIYMKSEALHKCLDKRPNLRQMYERQRTYIPNDWLVPSYAALFPEESSELAYIAIAK